MLNDDNINLLIKEWEYVNKSVEWNYDLFEKHRNYSFLLIATVFGLSNLNPNEAGLAWIIIPPILLILMYRMLSQLAFIGVKNLRRAKIELEIAEVKKSHKYFRYGVVLSSEITSRGIYISTMIWMHLLIIGVYIYCITQAYQFIIAAQWPSGLEYLYVIMLAAGAIHYSYQLYIVAKKRFEISEVTKQILNADFPEPDTLSPIGTTAVLPAERTTKGSPELRLAKLENLVTILKDQLAKI